MFDKSWKELYIGSSVVAGNTESVKDAETKQKGRAIEKPTYFVLDNLELVEVYKGFQAHSNVAPNILYEILYDALEKQVKGVLCGVREEDGNISYYAVVKPDTKSVKKQISFYIEYVDFALLPAVEKEIREILELKEEKDIKEKFGNPPERIYAGSFIGSTESGLVLIPFATYKANEVIPAYTGEEDERIPQLEMKIEEINQRLAQIENTESEEYKKLQEERRELYRELTKLRNKLYNPDILKAIRSKGERLFITQKPEIRYLGENLIAAAQLYKDLKTAGANKIKGVYAVLTIPTYNNLAKKIQRSHLEVMLNLYSGGDIFPLELQKARQAVSVLEEALREIVKNLQAGAKPNLLHIKERIKENLSLRKRIEDLESYAISVLTNSPDELDLLIQQLEKFMGELEEDRRILYSPFTTNRLITRYELLSLLQEAGANINEFTKETWSEFYEFYETLNETLENLIKQEFSNELKSLAKLFIKKLEKREPIHYKVKTKSGISEGYYPAENRPLTIVDLYPNKVLLNVIRTALRKLNAHGKLEKLENYEIFFEGVTARLEQYALTLFARKVFQVVAKNLLEKSDFNREEDIEALKEFLISNWLGEFKKVETAKESREEEIIEFDGLEDLLTED